MKQIVQFVYIISFLFLTAGCSSIQSTYEKSENAANVQNCRENQNEYRQNSETGKRILLSIYIYYAENHIYPNTLDYLVPDYLSEIPKTVMGRDFRYYLPPMELQQKDEPFSLVFDLSRPGKNIVCAFSQKMQKMEMSDGWDCGSSKVP